MSNSSTTLTQFSMPSVLLRAEGLAILIATLVLYAHLHFNGWVLLVLFFSLDVFMIGYLKDTRVGSIIYNIGHTEVAPIALALISLALSWEPGIMFALIWFGHIGLDRLMGYGLKYPTVFQDTHFQRI
jgi:hypothetical protein